MSEIVPFDYNNQQVRTIEHQGEPWFVAADVCAVLDIGDARQAVDRLDEDDRCRVPVVDAVGRHNPNTWVVNESGLYELIIRSDKPEARTFRRWITSEVLPAIRKTGHYEVEPRDQLDVLAEQVAQLQRVRDDAQQAQQTAERAQDTAEETSARLDAIEGRHDWFAALGYAKLTGLPSNTVALARLGRMASAIGRDHGEQANKVHHALYGEVNQWPRWVWDAAAEQLGINAGGAA